MTYPSTSTDWLIRLISYNTTSHLSNLAMIEDIRAFAVSLGISSIISHNASGDKANLLLSIYNAKDHPQGGVVLSAHSDVVPVEQQTWQLPPFEGSLIDNKIYGRGACDMKGFIACCLNFLPKARTLADNNKLSTPLHLAISYDEEVGCLGVPSLIEDITKAGICPDFCIIGEPTNMDIVVAHKGIGVYRCTVVGASAHSSFSGSKKGGVNAIVYAAKMIEFIDTLAKKIQNDAKNYNAQNLSQDITDFDTPFNTLSIGLITGGSAINITPNHCQFDFECRFLPTQSTQIIRQIQDYATILTQSMQNLDGHCRIDIQELTFVPAMHCTNQQVVDLLTSLLPDSRIYKAAYACEGGCFDKAGISTIICGPGSIEQAHKPDEFIHIDQLIRCDEFLERLFG